MKIFILYKAHIQPAEHPNEWTVEIFDTPEQAFLRSMELKKQGETFHFAQKVDLKITTT